LVAEIRVESIRHSFDFIPEPNPEHLVHTFREWMAAESRVVADTQPAGEERSRDELFEALLDYRAYLSRDPAATRERLVVFNAYRRQVVDSHRQRLAAFRPARPAGRMARRTPVEDLGNGPFLDFLSWVRRQYHQPTHSWIRSAEVALEEDLNGYDRYLQENVFHHQRDEFRLLRRNIENAPFSFTPTDPERRSFAVFLSEENQRRRETGEDELAGLEAIRAYNEVVISDAPVDVVRPYVTTLYHYLVGNRRQFYGHPRGAYYEAFEEVLTAQDALEELLVTFLEHAHAMRVIIPDTNWKVYILLMRRRIAMEEEISEEQWATFNEALNEARRHVQEIERMAQEERVDEIGRIPVPRSPESVASTESDVSERPSRLYSQRGLAPVAFQREDSSDSGDDDDFPLI
jgi:hypothetical protein